MEIGKEIIVVTVIIISVEGVVNKFLKCLDNIGLTKSALGVEQKAIILQTCHSGRKFLGHAP